MNEKLIQKIKNKVDSDKPEQNLKFPFQLKVMIKKTAGNCRNSYVAEKRIILKPLKILIPNFDSIN